MADAINNLFVMHTQYNIILSSSIVLNRLSNQHNDLIVYAEFNITEQYKQKLQAIFNNVFFIREKFEPLPKERIREEILLFYEYKKFYHSILAKIKYDNIFLSQDRPLDCLIVGHFKKKKRCVCSDIEEDCYYSLRKKLNEPNYIRPQKIYVLHKLRKLIYGKKYLYETSRFFYGQSSFFDTYYVLYPNCVRPELMQAKLSEIFIDEIEYTIGKIYDSQVFIPVSPKYYLLFFDLIERYKDINKINNIFSKIANKAKEEDALLLIKYHPRETVKFDTISYNNIYEIQSSIPAEKVLCDLKGKDLIVIGNATTSILVANKFGFVTKSIAKIICSDNEVMMNKFKTMGIEVPESIDNL